MYPASMRREFQTAEKINAAEQFEKRLVGEEDFFWVINIEGMRRIIIVAREADDIESALIEIAANTRTQAD